MLASLREKASLSAHKTSSASRSLGEQCGEKYTRRSGKRETFEICNRHHLGTDNVAHPPQHIGVIGGGRVVGKGGGPVTYVVLYLITV